MLVSLGLQSGSGRGVSSCIAGSGIGILGFNSVDFSVFALSDVMRLRAAIDSPLGLLGLDSMPFAACDAMRM
jgi:hypothetical protein